MVLEAAAAAADVSFLPFVELQLLLITEVVSVSFGQTDK